MKVAAVKWQEKNIKNYSPKKFAREIIKESREEKVKVLCFPGLFGELFFDEKEFVNFFLERSKENKDIAICPGTYLESKDGKKYHTSLLIKNGEILLEQRQLYLSHWERKRNISRGERVQTLKLDSFTLALILPTDQFYPQVSRYLALSGVNLVLAPSAVVASKSSALQISGLWQNVQQNLFFALESGYEGRMFNLRFSTETIIHAPLEISPREDGFLKKAASDDLFISQDIQLKDLEEASKFYNPIRQLNPKSYESIFRKGRGG